MKILMINVVCGIRSTGRICTDLATALETQGHEVKIAYGREEVPEKFKKYAVRIGSDLDVKLHGVKARLFDGCGWGSKRATEKFIEWVKEWNPDIIHLHNIHGYYLNVEVLFNYLHTCGKKIIWTLHDCWAFTGHAAFCDVANCERWINGCHECPKKNDYPAAFIDRSKDNWKIKKEIFTNVKGLVLVTPSEWLARLVKKSHLSQYPATVIHNGVDINVFKNTPSDIKEKLKIGNRKLILGVAALWEERKGLYDFYKVAEKLDPNNQIVLVGLSKGQIKALPPNIIGIERTNSLNELVDLYSAAEVYVNPTYEDNYPTTNLEAIACETPVVTYDTGGSGESARLYGTVVEKGNIRKLVNAIEESYAFEKEQADIGMTQFVSNYIKLYSLEREH